MAVEGMKKGIFITFEGSEGSGKSTQSRLLAAFLRRQGHGVVYLREPGGTAVSEKIRRILLDNRNQGLSCGCEMLLYMAARAQVVSEIILPALKRGCCVVCDRFLDSTRAYQGYGLGLQLGLIEQIGRFATGGLEPDLTVVMDLPVEDGLKHRHGRKDRIEKRSLLYHRRVRRGYLSIARLDPQRVKVVRVQADKRTTQDQIRMIVMDRLNARTVCHSIP